MIVDERFISYLQSLETPEIDYLDRIRKEALETYVPIIRYDTQQYMKFLMQSLKPKNILEVGTAVGFSALLMEAYNPVDCKITTIENYEPRIPIALKNFEDAGKADVIKLLPGNAQDILPTIEDSYDFIFMDAAKGQYPIFLPEIKRLMHSGSVLVTDNILQDGDLIESHYAIERRDRTIHKRMREYLYTLTHDEDMTCSIIPVGDGLAMCVMK
ncbi:MAG: O-methyltransferase [Lachnospiraceae bacterium]|nr:O-methyltransferase [Lachnospiraceae bacterium]